MKALVDTAAFLYWASDSPRLTRAARRAFTDARTDLYLSAVSAWEIAIKWSLGKLKLPEEPARFVPSRMRAHRIAPLGFEHADALACATLPELHDDPFDRALVAQALGRKLRVLTPDERFEEYGVDVVW